MGLFSLNFHGKSEVNVVATDNENSVSQADVRDMLARIDTLEAKVEELRRDRKPCDRGNAPLPERPSLFGGQQKYASVGQSQSSVAPSLFSSASSRQIT